jgi:Heterokaryon incompatibility protein (HET)
MKSLKKLGKKIKLKASRTRDPANSSTDALSSVTSLSDKDESDDDPFSFVHPSRQPLNVDVQSQRLMIESPSDYPYPDEIREADHDALLGKCATWAEVQAREDRWEKEKTKSELIQGKTPRPGLCRICRAINLIQGDKFSSRSGIKFVPFGTSTQLACRAKHCAICRVTLEIIICNSSQVHPELVAVDPEVQGTQLFPEVLPSGEVLLGVEHALRRIGAIRIIAEENAMEVLRQAYEPGAVIDTTAAENVLADKSGQRVSCSLIRKWLSDCQSEHGATCNALGVNLKDQDQMNIMLIDVIEQKLILASTAMKFFSLSYVWGQVSIPLTLLANVDARCKDYGLSEDVLAFPQVIKDAIKLVRDIGERYLWVDAICIVQDDSTAKHQQILRMDRIYSEAFATIIALAGADANASIPGVRGGTRDPQAMHHMGGHHMVATPPPLKYVLKLSKWDTRAWTAQERWLSQRCLFFSKDHVYFQCGSQVLCEIGGNTPYGGEKSAADANPLLRSLLGQPVVKKTKNPRLKLVAQKPQKKKADKDDETGEDDGWQTEGSSASVHTVDAEEVPLKEDHHDQTEGGDLRARDSTRQFDFDIYEELVEMYTKRELSYVADISSAFSGLTSGLECVFGGKLFFGIPSEALDLALLWTPTRTLRPRVLDAENGVSMDVFPTWSWMGWVGPVNYLLATDVEDTFALPEVESFQIHYNGNLHTTERRKWTKSEAYVPSQIQAFLRAWVKRPESPPRVPDSIARPMPDLPSDATVLQFWAQVVPATKFTLKNAAVRYLSSPGHTLAQGQQSIRTLGNLKGQHCGILFNSEETDFLPHNSMKREFVLLSRYKDDDERRMELNTVSGELNIWDLGAFGRVMTGNSLMNLLLVQSCGVEADVSRRVTVAQIHSKAWQEAEPEVKLVRLK